MSGTCLLIGNHGSSFGIGGGFFLRCLLSSAQSGWLPMDYLRLHFRLFISFLVGLRLQEVIKVVLGSLFLVSSVY